MNRQQVLKQFITKCNSIIDYNNKHKNHNKTYSDEMCIQFRKLIHFTHEHNIFDAFHPIFANDDKANKKLNDLKAKANSMLNKKKK